MISINVQSEIDGEAKQIAPELLTMGGVNYELMPMVKMTAPEKWYKSPIYEWPESGYIFSSVILLFGFIPVDLHKFGLLDTSLEGIRESSTSLIIKSWRHDRVIEDLGKTVRVIDILEIQPKVKTLAVILAPIYEQIFKHRHKRLKQKYGAGS